QVVEGIEAEPEFIDLRGRDDPRIRCHRLVYMRLHLASIKEKRRRLAFTAPTISAEPTGLRGLREVDALNELIFVRLAVRGRLVVVRNQIRIKIRWRVKFEKLLRNRADLITRDHIALKWVPKERTRSPRIWTRCGRVVDPRIRQRENFGEVPRAHLHGWHAIERPGRPAFVESFEVRHEEEPIGALIESGYSYGTSHSETILIPFERVFGAFTGKGVLFRVELVIAEKLEQRSVELVGSRFG